MKETKGQKGITLIALVITIVVLLILAAVAISSIQNDGILHYAQNAADSWNKASQNESTILDSYMGYLNPCLEKGHTYGDWTTVTEADCSTETNGSKERTCSVCGTKETQVVNYIHQGFLMHGYGETCSVCGATDCEGPTYFTEIEAIYESGHECFEDCEHCTYHDHSIFPHSYVKGVCSVCGYEQ